MTSHRYRKVKHPRGATPMSTKHEVRWRGQAYLKDPTTVALGTFDTAERASIAVRLFEHWVARGHNPCAIPRQPRTRDAI